MNSSSSGVEHRVCMLFEWDGPNIVVLIRRSCGRLRLRLCLQLRLFLCLLRLRLLLQRWLVFRLDLAARHRRRLLRPCGGCFAALSMWLVGRRRRIDLSGLPSAGHETCIAEHRAASPATGSATCTCTSRASICASFVMNDPSCSHRPCQPHSPTNHRGTPTHPTDEEGRTDEERKREQEQGERGKQGRGRGKAICATEG
jgi:hypothetical protein